MPTPKRYRCIKEVTVEPMVAYDFLASRQVPIKPMNLNSYHKGFKLTDAKGFETWMPAEEFEAEYREIKQEDESCQIKK